MMNYKNIIIIAVLALSFGFLAFSIGFYLKQKAASVELPAEIQVTNQIEEPAAEIIYTEEWSKIFTEARLARDAAKCESISDLAARRDCGDKINLGIAYEDKNINLCRAIFTPALRDSCYINLGIELSVDYCRYLSSENLRISCNEGRRLTEIIDAGDADRCAELGADAQPTCYSEIIYSFASASRCVEVSDAGYRQTCEDYFK